MIDDPSAAGTCQESEASPVAQRSPTKDCQYFILAAILKSELNWRGREAFQGRLAFQAIPDKAPSPTEPDPTPTANDELRRRIDKSVLALPEPSG